MRFDEEPYPRLIVDLSVKDNLLVVACLVILLGA